MSQHSSSSGAKKRKLQIADEDAASVASSGPSAFSQSVKQRVTKLDSAYCCSRRWFRTARSPSPRSASPDNAIPLCGLCHTDFDDINYPGFIFLPADLQYFIEIEEKNFAARKAQLQATGQYQPRLFPSAAQYRHRYFLRHVKIKTETSS
ncbi:hypothetical protein LTR04_003538 [Oleoguttula sp. CCFEE 6159]|nr:hypothetical protein LTR04_003538 [Oleoguttula sp. CCFEE 6159]